MKKRKKSNQNLILNLFATIIFIALIAYLVMAAGTSSVVVPVVGGNYSGTITFNCSTAADNENCVDCLNASIWYNLTGPYPSTYLGAITNDTNNDTFFNDSISVASLTDGTTYNFTCVFHNATGNVINASTTIQLVTIDNTSPNVSTFQTTIDGGNYTGNITMNVSVDDSTMGVNSNSIFFNVTNASSGVLATYGNWTQGFTTGIGAYNASFNTHLVSDGFYNITVWANDTTLNNVNNSEYIKIRVDNTAPSTTVTKTSSSINSITLAVSITESGSGIQTCTCDRGTASVSGSGNSWTVIESSMDQGNSATYTVTCTDYAGLSSSYALTTSTDTSGGVTTGGGGTSRATTYTATEEQFKEGYTKSLGTNDKISVKIEDDTHQVSVSGVTASTATITVSSTPQTATLNIGDIRRFDVTDDSYYDVQATLNSISNNKADITIKSIHEEVTVETTAEEQEKEAGVAGVEEEIKANLLWLWILVAVIVIVIIAFIIYKKKKY